MLKLPSSESAYFLYKRLWWAMCHLKRIQKLWKKKDWPLHFRQTIDSTLKLPGQFPKIHHRMNVASPQLPNWVPSGLPTDFKDIVFFNFEKSNFKASFATKPTVTHCDRSSSFLSKCLIKHSWTFLNINEHSGAIWPARYKNNEWTFLNMNEVREQREGLRAWHNRWETVTFTSTPRSTCAGTCPLHVVAVHAPCNAGSSLVSQHDMTSTESFNRLHCM